MSTEPLAAQLALVLWTLFLRPLEPGSYLFGACLPDDCVRGFFWETTSGFIHVFSAMLGSTVATWYVSPQRLWDFTHFCVKADSDFTLGRISHIFIKYVDSLPRLIKVLLACLA